MKNIRDIPNWEGLYAITKDGEVWAYPRKRIRNGVTLNYKGCWRQPSMTKRGYAMTVFHKSNGGANPKGYRYFIHRLVALTYISPVPGKIFVNHKDGNKLNNNVSNLEWCTTKENINHAFRTGLKISSKGESHGMSRFKENDIRTIRTLYDTGVKSPTLARMFDSSKTHILRIVKRELWKHVT